MYRSRHKEDLDRRTLNFLSSIEIDNKILFYDILCSKAHVLMLYKIRILNKFEFATIVNALDQILRNRKRLVREGFEDIHEAIEAHLIHKIGVDIGGKIQTGRSRNDQIITDVKIKARDDLISIISHLINLVRILLQKSEENLDSIMPLYTHLQQAQNGNLAHYFLSYSESLLREVQRLFSLYKRINQSPLGAGPIGGSLLPIDRKMTAKLLGFEKIVLNTIDATSSRDFMIEFLSDISSIMITLSRCAEDLIIWSSDEFGFIEIHEKFTSTSSAMPQKKNPDPLEMIRSKTGLVIGNFTGLMIILKALPSGYSRDLQDTKLSFWNSIDTVSLSLEIVTDIIATLGVNKDVMATASKTSYATAFDIAEVLVIRHKVPFRTAHKLVGALVAKGMGNKEDVPFMSLSNADVKVILEKMKVSMSPVKLIHIIKDTTPQKSIANRRSEGSPNPRKQMETIKKYRILLDNYQNQLQIKKKNIEHVQEKIIDMINQIKDKAYSSR
jgi:argininosuccinate lyase